MIRLVANADDAGIDPGRSRGILRAFQEGIVTSASVLAGFPASEEFLQEARSARSRDGSPLGLGLHLNLSAGEPLAAGGRSLVGDDGRFPGKVELWRRALAGSLDAGEVAREVRTQWEWLAARGVALDHVNGHHHAHVLPGIAEVVATAVPRGTWVRFPCEGAGHPQGPGIPVEEVFRDSSKLAEALAGICRRARAAFEGRLRMPDGFLGLGLLGGNTAQDLAAALGKLLERARPPGRDAVLELMAHPGEIDPASEGFSADPARAREVQALMDPELREFLRARGIALSSFGRIP